MRIYTPLKLSLYFNDVQLKGFSPDFEILNSSDTITLKSIMNYIFDKELQSLNNQRGHLIFMYDNEEFYRTPLVKLEVALPERQKYLDVFLTDFVFKKLSKEK